MKDIVPGEEDQGEWIYERKCKKKKNMKVEWIISDMI